MSDRKYLPMTSEQKEYVEDEVKLMIAAHRDTLWTRYNTNPESYKCPNNFKTMCTEGYYGEAFGIMRGLAVLGYGHLGSDTTPDNGPEPWRNLKWWFNQLVDDVLNQECWRESLGFEIIAVLDYYRNKSHEHHQKLASKQIDAYYENKQKG